MDRKLLEQIDACRSMDELRAVALHEQGGEEGADEAFAGARAGRLEQADRLLSTDGAICRVMHEVELPLGLADRIMTALSAPELRRSNVIADEVLSGPIVPSSETEVAEPVRTTDVSPAVPVRSRRSLLARLAPAAVVLLIGVSAIAWLTRQPAQLDPDEVVQWVGETQDSLPMGRLAATFPASTPPPAPYQVPRFLTAVSGGVWGWHSVRGCPAVVHERSENGWRARLYVIKLPTRPGDLPPQPPFSPQTNTGGRCVGVWAHSGMVYALVVEGRRPEVTYDHLLHPGVAT